VTVGGEEAEKNERSKVTETKIRSNAKTEERRKSDRSNTIAQLVTNTTVSFSPSSSPCCNTREEKEEAYASPQTGRSNSSKHCPPSQKKATVCSHQCHLKPPSTTTSHTKGETGDRSGEKKEHKKKTEQRRNRTTIQQHITDSFNSRKNGQPPGKPPLLFFFFFFPGWAAPLFTLHVNSGEFSTVCFCLLGRAVPARPNPKWAGWVRPSQKKLEKYF
jgi:hypothetical protein